MGKSVCRSHTSMKQIYRIRSPYPCHPFVKKETPADRAFPLVSQESRPGNTPLCKICPPSLLHIYHPEAQPLQYPAKPCIKGEPQKSSKTPFAKYAILASYKYHPEAQPLQCILQSPVSKTSPRNPHKRKTRQNPIKKSITPIRYPQHTGPNYATYFLARRDTPELL
jgi:hypothetical protein